MSENSLDHAVTVAMRFEAVTCHLPVIRRIENINCALIFINQCFRCVPVLVTTIADINLHARLSFALAQHTESAALMTSDTLEYLLDNFCNICVGIHCRAGGCCAGNLPPTPEEVC